MARADKSAVLQKLGHILAQWYLHAVDLCKVLSIFRGAEGNSRTVKEEILSTYSSHNVCICERHVTLWKVRNCDHLWEMRKFCKISSHFFHERILPVMFWVLFTLWQSRLEPTALCLVWEGDKVCWDTCNGRKGVTESQNSDGGSAIWVQMVAEVLLNSDLNYFPKAIIFPFLQCFYLQWKKSPNNRTTFLRVWTHNFLSLLCMK